MLKLLINVVVILFLVNLILQDYEYQEIVLFFLILSSVYLGRDLGLNRERQIKRGASPPSLPKEFIDEQRMGLIQNV